MADNLTKLVVQIGADTADLKKGMADASKSTDAFGATFKGVVAGIVSSNLAGKVLDMSKKAVAGFGDLEQAVANISTIKPEINTSAVFASLNEMQTRVPQTAAQLGDSLYNIFSSIDVSQQDALKLLETFARGATGAATDAQTFGTSVLGVMNAYGLSVKDAEHISDVFFATVNKGVITGQELASSLGPVTQSAKAAGVSLDELGGFIAGVTKEGGPAAQNVNNLNNLFQKITTNEAQKEINNLGVATVNAQGKFRPMADILTDLKGKLGGMTEAAKLNALQTIFPDAQARQGAMTILSQLDMVKAAIKDNQTATGTAADAYKKMSATFNTQSALLSNTFQSMLTTIGANVLPAVTPVITAFAAKLPSAFHTTGEAIAFVQGHSDELKPAALALAGIVAGVLVPATVTWTATAYANATALGAQAVAAAAAYAPFVAIGVATGLAAAGIIHFADSLDIEINNTRRAQEEGAKLLTSLIAQAAATDPLIQQWLALTKTNSDLNEQLSGLNNTLRNFQVSGALANEAVTALSASGQQNTEAFKAAAKEWTNSQAEIQALQNVAKGLGFELQMAADGQTAFTFGAQLAAQASKQEAVAVDQHTAAVKTAAAATIPFGAELLELTKKSTSVAESFDKANKFIDDLAGHMTGTEQVLTRSGHSLDAVASSAQAAFSSKSSDSISFWADQAKKAADSAALGEEPTRKLDSLIDQIAKHGPGSAAALETLKKVIADSKAPIDDANKAYSDQRTVMGDLAKEQLGLGGSLDALRTSIVQFVQVFMLQMGRIPPDAESISSDTLKAFAIGGAMNTQGQNAIQGFITGMLIKRAMAEETARIIALGAVVATSGALRAESPSKVMKELGEWAGEGLAIGWASTADHVAASARMTAEAGIDAAIQAMGHDGSQFINDFLSQFNAPSGGGGFSQMAADIASSAAPLDAMRGNLAANRQELAGVNARLLELHRQLLNTGPHDANREALQKEIQELQQTKSELTSVTSAYNALVKEMAEGATALDGFTAQMTAMGRNAENVARFGQTGAQSVDALVDAIMDGSPKAGAAAATLVNSMAEAARKAGVPNWRELAAAEAAAYQQAIADHSPESIQAALDATQALADATQAQVDKNKPTLQSAFADAFGADQIAAAVGSSWGTVFTQSAAAIEAGKELPIVALGRFRADAVAELAKLPQDMRDRLGPEAQAAWDAFVANPSADALARLQTNAAQIRTAALLIPESYGDMSDRTREHLLRLQAAVDGGMMTQAQAVKAAGAVIAAAPEDWALYSTGVKAILDDLDRKLDAGSITPEQYRQRVAAVIKAAPEDWKNYPPAIAALLEKLSQDLDAGLIDVKTYQRESAAIIATAPDAWKKYPPAVQAQLAELARQLDAGIIDLKTYQERSATIIHSIPQNWRDATPAISAELDSIRQLYLTGAIDAEEMANRMEKATARAQAAAQAAAAAMAASIAGAAPPVTHSSTSSTGIQTSETSNAFGVPGMSSSTVTEPGQQPVTTVTYGGKTFAFPGTVNEDQMMQALGFTNKASWEAWKEAQRKAHLPGGASYNDGAGAAGGPGAYQAYLDFIAQLNGQPPAPHADGGVFTTPTIMFDTSGRRHLFGEREPEVLAPLSSLAWGGSANSTSAGNIPLAGGVPNVTIIVQGDVNDADTFAQKVQAAMQKAMQRRY